MTLSATRRIRSLLFAPANRPDLLAKAHRSAPDAVVIDLEDAVPVADKPEARALVAGSAEGIASATGRRATVLVRVNAVPTPWFRDDVAAAAAPHVDGIVVPKLERADQLDVVRRSLTEAGRDDAVVIAGIETVAGVDAVRHLLQPPIVAAYFGAEDFVADIGGVRTSGSLEVLYARSRVAMAARLAGIPALDQVVVAYHDDAAFRDDARDGRAIGYRGKICIHPAQVPLANEIFGHTAEEVARARRIVAAIEEGARSGSGVVSVDGQMVDEPIVRLARELLAEVEQHGA